MERHFDEGLKALKERLLYMASLAEAMIHWAVQELMVRKAEMLSEVMAKEQEVNQIHIEIDDRCLKLIARHQPMAMDLRLITAAMKINSDLERIADQAVNIAQTTDFFLKEPKLEPLLEIPRMAELAQKMVRDSLDAFVKQDVDLARSVCTRDDEVDTFKHQAFNNLLTFMTKEPACIHRALDLILISRNLERIADHATNIAEDVIFMVLGKDIRHHIENRMGT
ncbi:MAG: phosphate signaling complex protein PhoU [Elusimicrobia bacterium]|nr:phosphate signaling complex protein PhoU [Elusimicrobiota bacterium]